MLGAPVNRDVALLLALICIGAGWGFLHVLLWLRVLRSPALPTWLRALALIPPLLPIEAWQIGARIGALAWTLLTLAYLALRSLA